MSTDFGADSSSRFPSRVRTNAQTNKQTDRRNYPTPMSIQPTWVMIVVGCKLRAVHNFSACSFYRAANSIFVILGRFASAEVS